MRSTQWQYLGYVMLGLGLGLLVSGVAFAFYLQQRPTMSRYASLTIPMMSFGARFLAFGVPSLLVARERRIEESSAAKTIPPPPASGSPPQPPPPPPPPRHD